MPIFKRITTCSLILILSQTLLHSSAPPWGRADFYQQALKAKERGDFDQAITLFRQAAAASPNQADARLQLGLIFIKLRRWKEAEGEFKKFLQIRPDSFEGRNNLAAVYAQLGMSENLVHELKAIVRLKPDLSQGHVNLSDYYLILAIRSLWHAYRSAPPLDRAELASKLQKLLPASPNQAETYFIRGGMALLQGDSQQAREFYDRAGQLDPDYQPPRLLEEAKRLSQQDELDEALDHLLVLPVLGATCPDSELLVAEILVRKNQYDAALKHLDYVSARGVVNLRYNLTMAAALKGIGQPGKAAPYLEAALSGQNRADIRQQLAEAYKASGDFTKAVGEYEKLLSAEADSAWIQREIMDLTKKKLQAAGALNGTRSASGSSDAVPARYPRALLLLPSDARCALVEKETQTLLLYRSTPSGFFLEKTFACSTGAKEGEKIAEGDNKTPEGIYFFHKILPGSQLPDAYGKMAITLDYPNAYDRLEGKSGDGIWVHATNEKIRPYLPNKTRGCVVVSNEDVLALAKLIVLKRTPLVIVSKIHYQAASELQSQVTALKSFLSEWRQNWENKLIGQYIAMYSSRFRNGAQNLKAWKQQKEGIFSRAGKIQLRVDLESIVRHEKYTVLTFRQDYRSQRLRSAGTKRLFVVQEHGAWKIIAEVLQER